MLCRAATPTGTWRGTRGQHRGHGDTQQCFTAKQQGWGYPWRIHRAAVPRSSRDRDILSTQGHHRQASGSRGRNSSQEQCCCHGVRGVSGTGHSLLLYRANIMGGWGCPASGLEFKEFSLGMFIPQCSPCHSPAVTQWGPREDTGLDTDKLQSPALLLAGSRMVAVPPTPLSPVVPRSCCPSMPAMARGTAPFPTAGQLELLRGWHPLSSSPKPGPS